MRTGRTTAASLAIVLGGLFAILGVQPAMAHSALTGSTPADGAVVTEPLDRVDLTFSEAPLTGLDAGLRIQVTDADGTDVSTGEVTVSGMTMGKAVDLENGAYTVLWRYVSPDGHPIDGSFGFEYRAAVATAPATTPSTTPSSSPPVTPTPTSSATATGASDGAPDSPPGIAPGVWVALAAGTVLAAAAVVVLLLRRGGRGRP
ncbi:copper resistance CopC family protein [Curtobacterium sp. VKM Ac-1393]|uniref:copper resistance CopC family protein n=1 Tax=Curtobacterium sp. VKM Ac-1393 TaxID=2783814 RepID=UPI00188D030D|nr:copper resistance CopC family protein [Curtobacterium sp. VKM Ac-1393]MBF4607807.1 copper resistance protein CopC [Curtobacterium sp. VKM Ac-1393]